jgi:hypothetical protein
MTPDDRRKLHDDIGELVREITAGGRRCSKCGGTMAHYRLWGYRCVKGCEREPLTKPISTHTGTAL